MENQIIKRTNNIESLFLAHVEKTENMKSSYDVDNCYEIYNRLYTNLVQHSFIYNDLFGSKHQLQLFGVIILYQDSKERNL